MSTSATEQTTVSRSPEETWEIARRLLEQLPGPAVIALHGTLGAGKTCFVQGLAIAMGIDAPVTSPTFTVINEYRAAGRRLAHVDLYRLHNIDEIVALGFEDYMAGGGITAVEWAERAGDLVPPDAVHVTITAGGDPDERRIAIGARPQA